MRTAFVLLLLPLCTIDILALISDEARRFAHFIPSYASDRLNVCEFRHSKDISWILISRMNLFNEGPSGACLVTASLARSHSTFPYVSSSKS